MIFDITDGPKLDSTSKQYAVDGSGGTVFLLGKRPVALRMLFLKGTGLSEVTV